MSDKHLMQVIAEFAALRGAKGINALPGCWECRVDEDWLLAVNGHAQPMHSGLVGCEVQPFSAVATWKGWPAVVADPGGWEIAAGAECNETEFRAALAAAEGGAADEPADLPL